MYKNILLIVLSFFFVSCGESGNKSTSDTEVLKESFVGTLYDAPISNVRYSCESKISYTNERGEFSCYLNSEISFYISNILLGKKVIDEKDIHLTPHKLFNVHEDNFDDIRIKNFIRLVQSFDEDKDNKKIIIIPSTIHNNEFNEKIDLNKTALNIDEFDEIVKYTENLISEDEAILNYKKSLLLINIDKLAPKLSEVIYSQKEETNKDIEVIIESEDEDIIVPNGWEKNNNQYKKRYTNNIKEIVEFKDKAGNKTTKEIIITNIDKLAPKLSEVIYSQKEETNKDIEVIIESEDEDIIVPNGWEKNNNQYKKRYTNNIKEIVEFKDKAGNKTVKEIVISNINKSLPFEISILNDTPFITENDTYTLNIQAEYGSMVYLNDDKYYVDNVEGKINIDINFSQLLESKSFSLFMEDSKQLKSNTINFDVSKVFNISTEELFKYQWYLNKSDDINYINNYSIDNESHINIIEAWNYSRGENIKIAIIDDYFDVEHEEYSERIVSTYSADEETNDVSRPLVGQSNHGTKVAGIIAAGKNNKGILGIAPKSELILISLKNRNKIDDSNIDIVLKAFDFARDNGANIINCSWGTKEVHPLLRLKLEELKNEGIIVVFASGNKSLNFDEDLYFNDEDESELDSVIGVSASTSKNTFAEYSNYGQNIDFLAPGGGKKPYITDSINGLGILTTNDSGNLYGDPSRTSFTFLSEKQQESYTYSDGTSFSAPIVSGVIALMKSVNKNLSFEEIYDILKLTSQKIESSTIANYDQNGFDIKRAYGKIDAGKAVKEVYRRKIVSE